MEQRLNIKENKKGDKTYYNISPKDMDVGNYCVVEKLFAEGMEVKTKFGTAYSWKVKYQDKECTFLLNEKLNASLSAVGGIGDRIKINCEEKRVVNPKTKVTSLYKNLLFEIVA